jgi:hypothetical protein
MRIELYILHRLNITYLNQYLEKVRIVITNIDNFLGILVQSYGDLDKVRILELQLMELR